MKYVTVTAGMCLQLLGLTGLVDSIVVWTDFLASIIETYVIARDYVFGLLPFAVANWVKNYLVIGLGIVGAMARTHEDWLRDAREDSETFLAAIAVVAFVVGFSIVIWPVLIMLLPFRLRTMRRERNRMFKSMGSDENPVEFAKQIATTAVVFLAVLFLFSDLLKRGLI